jgi:hypothetical protein
MLGKESAGLYVLELVRGEGGLIGKSNESVVNVEGFRDA